MPVDPARIWASLKGGWQWIPIAGAIWLALGLVVAFRYVRHTYKAETVLVWEPVNRADTRQLATEAGSLTLPGFLREVKRSLKLKMSAMALEKQIEVWFDTGSNLVTIQASGPSAGAATKLADGLVQVFLQEQRNLARARAGDAIRVLASDLAAARTRLQQVRADYDTFRSQQGISDIDRQKELALGDVARLKQQLQTVQTEIDTLDAQAAELGNVSRTQTRTVQSESVTNPDIARLAQVRAELATARTHLAPGHPRLAMLLEQEAELVKSTSAGTHAISNTVTGLNPEYKRTQTTLATIRLSREVAVERLKSYTAFVQEAERRLTELLAVEGKARGFLTEIGTTESRISDLTQKLSLANDAARTPQIDWRVLTPAIEPEWPQASKRRAIAAGMPIVGMLVAFLVLVLRPVVSGRVFTAREAAFWANLPVIVSSGWPRNRDLFFTLIDELGDQGNAAHGYTLVLGATGREKAMAEELAYWLGGGTLKQQEAEAGSEPQAVHVPHAATATAAAGAAGSTALAPVMRQVGSGIALFPQGTHAWLGTSEGPALRRAARMADRVLVLLTSGADTFVTVAGLRNRLGRNQGVGVVLLGLTPELLKLPDRVGDVDGFWRRTSRT